MRDFRHREMRELYRQLMLSPEEVRRRYVDRLEELLLELEPERTYPYEFPYFRITGFRPREAGPRTITGREALPDLERALSRLSQSVPTPAEAVEEELYTQEEAAERLGVSRRTVQRWRRRGLVARAYAFPDGRVRAGIRASALRRYVEENRPSVEASRRFTRVTAQEEARLLAAARARVRAEGMSPTAAAERVAREAGRAPETVRALLKRHGVEPPDRKSPPSAPGPLEEDQRRAIYEDYLAGAPVRELAGRYGRSRSSIYRVLNRERAAVLLQEPIEYVADEGFAEEDAEERILGDELKGAAAAVRGEPDVETPTLAAPATPPLSRSEEKALFRAYNYAKFRAAEERRRLNPRRYVPTRLLRRIRAHQERAGQLKELLERAHLPIVEHAAAQHAGELVSRDELIAQGGECLLELIESFDYRGRARFSGYLGLELMKRFARTLPPPGEPR